VGKPAVGHDRAERLPEGQPRRHRDRGRRRGIDTDSAPRRRACGAAIISAERRRPRADETILNLVFLPGLSTKSGVSELSGRGVGMDVVKTNISQARRRDRRAERGRHRDEVHHHAADHAGDHQRAHGARWTATRCEGLELCAIPLANVQEATVVLEGKKYVVAVRRGTRRIDGPRGGHPPRLGLIEEVSTSLAPARALA
jgi:hypothetical protein